jgi:hypothetical protein
LNLGAFPWSFEYFSLVSFLDASPYLETLSLDVRCCLFYFARCMIALLAN